MEYRSPLGYNFKLEQSLSASRDDKSNESPRRDNYEGEQERPRKFFEPTGFQENRRNSGWNRNSYKSGWQRHSDQWKSPRNSMHNDTPSIEQLYHPSMLENPWEELERDLNSSKKIEENHS